VRIGLNAGEPVLCRGDLFGVAVSLAARLCAAARPSTILATEALPVLCLGKRKRFVEHGHRAIKGIEEPVTVCEVSWREGGDPPRTPHTDHQGLRAVSGGTV
jgi:adenylate cyclase